MQGQIRFQSFLLREPGKVHVRKLACGLKLVSWLREAKRELPEESIPEEETKSAKADR